MLCCLDFAEKHCVLFFPPCPQSSHLKALHATTGNTTSLSWNLGAGDCLCGMFCVQCSVQTQKREHAPTGRHLLKRGNARIWFENTKHYSYAHGLSLFVAFCWSLIAGCIGSDLMHQRATAGGKKWTLQIKKETKERYLAGLSHLWNIKPLLINTAFKVLYQITTITNHIITQRDKERFKNEALFISQYLISY